jgi:hypothetical protein
VNAPGPAEPDRDVEKQFRRFPRIPTPLIVTVLGISLSAWLIPAFTRQWDDRQKAQELKAGLVTEMSEAASGALIGSRARIFGLKPVRGEPSISEVGYAWSLAATSIEAKLRAYFPQSIVLDWRSYTVVVESTIVILAHTGIRGVGGELFSHDVSAALERLAERDVLPLSAETYMDMLFPSTTDKPGLREYTQAKQTILGSGEAIAAEVLAGHPRGYSTSRRDLLRDLLP